MKKAIILHGMSDSKEDYHNPNIDSPSNSHWLPWLQQQLIVNDILAQTPELPRAYKPNYEDWLRVFEQYEVDIDTILIGHSCGGGFLLRWISENGVNVGKVILVAPWIDPNNSIGKTFFKFEIDKHLMDKAKDVVVFSSDNDSNDVHESVKKIMDSIQGLKYKEFHAYGHFDLEAMKAREFPELLEEVLK